MQTADTDCGFPTALKVIGGKWKSDIVWQLHLAPRRFGRLGQLVPGISEKVLMQQLREMEADGIVHRAESPGRPVKVVYSLTEHGKTLNDGVHALALWGRAHRERAAKAQASAA